VVASASSNEDLTPAWITPKQVIDIYLWSRCEAYDMGRRCQKNG
jgi:hypothetical protein